MQAGAASDDTRPIRHAARRRRMSVVMNSPAASIDNHRSMDMVRARPQVDADMFVASANDRERANPHHPL